jgi:hypothetical protein
VISAPRLLVAALGLAIPQAGIAMPVDAFLARAEALQAKGFAALFSSDLKRLRDLALADLRQIGSERHAAEAAGRPTAFCPPRGGVRLSDNDVLDAMRAVPAERRAQTDSRDALRAYLARRFPCLR